MWLFIKEKGEDCVIIDRSKFPERSYVRRFNSKTYILLDRIFDN